MDQPHRQPLICRRVFLCQLGHNRIQIFRGLLRGNARLQPAYHRETRGPVLQVVVSPQLRFVRHGYPVVRPTKLLCAMELRGRHAHHGEGMQVHLHRSADDAVIAVKGVSPQIVAQYHVRGRAWAVIVRCMKELPCRRLHPQHIEIIAR